MIIEKGSKLRLNYLEGGWDLIEVEDPCIVPIGAYNDDDEEYDHPGFLLGRRIEASLQDVPEFWVEDADPPKLYFPGDWVLVPNPELDNRR